MMQTILKPEAMMIVRSQNRTKPVPKGNGDCLSQESLRLGILNGNRSELRAPKTGMSRNCKDASMSIGISQSTWMRPYLNLRGEQQSAIRCAEDSVNSSNKAPPIPERDWRRSVLLRGVRNGRSSPAEGRFQAMAR
jgi:hypothetical protein